MPDKDEGTRNKAFGTFFEIARSHKERLRQNREITKEDLREIEEAFERLPRSDRQESKHDFNMKTYRKYVEWRMQQRVAPRPNEMAAQLAYSPQFDLSIPLASGCARPFFYLQGLVHNQTAASRQPKFGELEGFLDNKSCLGYIEVARRDSQQPKIVVIRDPANFFSPTYQVEIPEKNLYTEVTGSFDTEIQVDFDGRLWLELTSVCFASTFFSSFPFDETLRGTLRATHSASVGLPVPPNPPTGLDPYGMANVRKKEKEMWWANFDWNFRRDLTNHLPTFTGDTENPSEIPFRIPMIGPGTVYVRESVTFALNMQDVFSEVADQSRIFSDLDRHFVIEGLSANWLCRSTQGGIGWSVYRRLPGDGELNSLIRQ